MTAGQVDGLLRGELDLGLARPPFDSETLASRVVHREALCAAVPSGHRLTSLGRALRPGDFSNEPIISYHPVQSRYFHELSVRFLTNAHPRIEQQVHQVLTVVLLVAAGRGSALVPAAARSLGVRGVTYLDLADGGRESVADAEVPGLPVETHAIWNRDYTNPALARVLDLLDTVTVPDEP